MGQDFSYGCLLQLIYPMARIALGPCLNEWTIHKNSQPVSNQKMCQRKQFMFFYLIKIPIKMFLDCQESVFHTLRVITTGVVMIQSIRLGIGHHAMKLGSWLQPGKQIILLCFIFMQWITETTLQCVGLNLYFYYIRKEYGFKCHHPS